MNIIPSQALSGLYDTFNRRFSIDNPLILIVLTIVIVLYYIVFKYLGSAGVEVPDITTRESGGIKAIEIIMWALFIFLILVNGLQYFFSLDIKTTIKNIFSEVPEIEIEVTDDTPVAPSAPTVPEIMIEKQVFNIPDNIFTYNDAEALCAAYDAKLATYKQIEKAYNRGAEWCNYGWSDGQMIFYPTQQDTYDNLQNIEGHKHDCGRPGINGGFIKDTQALFGVNCYGHKPEITSAEAATLGTGPGYPLTLREELFNDKVAIFRDILPEVLVSPFNNNNWSQI